MSLEILKQKIKDKNFSGVTYIYGAEEFLKDNYYQSIKKKSVTDMREFNVYEFSNEVSLNDLENILNSFPMMSDKKFIGITDISHNLLVKEDNKKELTRILSDVPEYACVVFLDTAQKEGKDAILAGIVNKVGGLCVNVERPNDSYLASWGKRQFKSAGREISGDDMYYILSVADKDMLSLQNEIKKIASFSAGYAVTKSDIDAVITVSLENNQFALSEALIKRNFKTAVRVIGDLYAQQYSDIQISSLIYKVIIDLMRGAWANYSCKRNIDMKADYGMHEYGAAKSMRAAQTANMQRLMHCVEMCLDCEQRLKSETGDKREMIYGLIAGLVSSGDAYGY